MRRKSTRNVKKPASPEKEKPETPKTRRQSRRRKKSPSSDSDDEVLVKPSSCDQQSVAALQVTTPDTTTKSHSPSDDEDAKEFVCKVTQSEDTAKGELQKLKICLTRPAPDSPIKTRRSKSNNSRSTTDEDISVEDKVTIRRTRSRGSPHVRNDQQEHSGKVAEDGGDEIEEPKGKGKSKGKHKSKIEKSPHLNEPEIQTNSEISENVQVTAQSPSSIDIPVDNDADDKQNFNETNCITTIDKCVLSTNDEDKDLIKEAPTTTTIIQLETDNIVNDSSDKNIVLKDSTSDLTEQAVALESPAAKLEDSVITTNVEENCDLTNIKEKSLTIIEDNNIDSNNINIQDKSDEIIITDKNVDAKTITEDKTSTNAEENVENKSDIKETETTKLIEDKPSTEDVIVANTSETTDQHESSIIEEIDSKIVEKNKSEEIIENTNIIDLSNSTTQEIIPNKNVTEDKSEEIILPQAVEEDKKSHSESCENADVVITSVSEIVTTHALESISMQNEPEQVPKQIETEPESEMNVTDRERVVIEDEENVRSDSDKPVSDLTEAKQRSVESCSKIDPVISNSSSSSSSNSSGDELERKSKRHSKHNNSSDLKRKLNHPLEESENRDNKTDDLDLGAATITGTAQSGNNGIHCTRKKLKRDTIDESDETIIPRKIASDGRKKLWKPTTSSVADLPSKSLLKIDLETIKLLIPTIEFPEENELQLDVHTYKKHRKLSSTTTTDVSLPPERKVSVEYSSGGGSPDAAQTKSRYEQQTSVSSSVPDNEEGAVTVTGVGGADSANTNIIAFNRKISIVDDSASKLKPPPSPARNPPSEVLFITNLVRPFTLKQLRELLERMGKIREDGFWTDRIKSKCYVYYESVEEAEATRNALHGIHWPVGNGKKLQIEYANADDLENAKNPPAPPPPPPVVEAAKVAEKENIELQPDKMLVASNDEHNKIRDGNRRPNEGPVREWDIGKKEVRREQRSRSRERVRKHRRSTTPQDDFITRKQKKMEETVPQKLMDDLFSKTKATPSIYWLPLSPEEIALKQQQRLIRMEEHKRRMEESSRIKGGSGRGDAAGRGVSSYRRRYD